VKAKKNIYLVQVDIIRKLPERTTAYLPYAAGALWAYARQSPAVAEAYALREIFLLRDPVDDVAAQVESPFLVGFSCYIWNTEYNKALAQAIKARWPGCLILFGGHNVPPGGVMLDELPYVDLLIHGEGEIPFQALLEQLCGGHPDLTCVPGLSYRAGETTVTHRETHAQSVADFPSPYLEGLFAPIVARHPELQWSIVWETNRGCPYNCSYCDWGQHKARVRQFPMARLLAEIEWMCANRVEFIWCADANFGLLPRDEEIVDALVAARARTGRPDKFECQTAKSLSASERLFRIAGKLTQSGLDKMGPNFAVQSLSPEVLRNIGRENLEDQAFHQWVRRCRQAGYRTHTDLIVGLPGETLQSFCAGVEKLYTFGQHAGVQFFTCVLLPNARMAVPAYREKHGIRAMRKVHKPSMGAAEEQITEFFDTVTETSAMPYADWLTAHYFGFLTTGAHSYGLLRYIAMYFHTEKIVSYAEFYLALLGFCHARPDSLPGQAMAHIEKYFTESLLDKKPEYLRIPGFSIGRMWEDQYFFSRAVVEPARFYADIETFLAQFVPAAPAEGDGGLPAQLLRYQRESIILPGAGEKTLAFDYDFPAYFNAIYDGEPAALQKRKARLRFSFEGDFSTNIKYYDIVVHNGRYSSAALYSIDYLPD